MVAEGDPLLLRYRMDANQVLHLRLARDGDDDPAEEFQLTVENPLTSVVNPNAKRDEILELEERMRTAAVPKAEQRETVERIAELEADLGRYERALSLLGSLNRVSPDGAILHRMGMIAGRLGDYEREEKLYREAARILSGWNGPLFNLALSQERQGRLTEAMQTIDNAIATEPDPPSLILKARLAGKLEQSREKCVPLLERAFAAFGPLATLSDFELSWYRGGARLAGDSVRKQAADKEHKRRGKKPVAGEPGADGDLPGMRNEIARMPQ